MNPNEGNDHNNPEQESSEQKKACSKKASHEEEKGLGEDLRKTHHYMKDAMRMEQEHHRDTQQGIQ
jgi:hypothetical protein